MVHQKRFHGFSVHNECIFDSRFSANAMELVWIRASLGVLIASEDSFPRMHGVSDVVFQLSDLESPAS